MKIIVVNAGSSSHKLSLYDIQHRDPIEPLWKGELDWGRQQMACSLSIQTKTGKQIKRLCERKNPNENLQLLVETMWKGETQVIEGPSVIERAGHRVVHGGKQFQKPTYLTPQVKEQIRKLIPLAPLHNPANLEGIELIEKLFPSIPQIAIFDTAFHCHMPEVTKIYPVPYAWREEGIERYGFHGISHHYCAERAAKILQRELSTLKMINCHLGNGSSLCAIRDGISIDTTMGFTPLEGLMMGTRSGSIDPGILFYLMKEKRFFSEQLDHILNFESGLKGIAGSSDMREIFKSTDEKAKLALKMYVYRLKSYIGAFLAHLEGVDVISFTGGIGENVAVVRQQACQGLDFLGIHLDQHQNETCHPDQDVAIPHSKVRLLVIHTQEEWMIALQAYQFNC